MILINLFNKIPKKNYYVHYTEHGTTSTNAYGAINYNLISKNVIGCNTKEQANKVLKEAKRYGYEPHITKTKPKFVVSEVERKQSQIRKEYMVYYFDCTEDWLR